MVLPGGNRERETPVPIPNTAVKPLIADGTALVTVWESRTLPGLSLYIYLKKKRPLNGLFFFIFGMCGYWHISFCFFFRPGDLTS